MATPAHSITEQARAFFAAGKESLAAQFAPATLNSAERSVDIVWFTGVDVPRYDWMTGTGYLLRFDPKGVDLSRLNSGAPLLDSHLSFGVDSQKGVVERAWKDGQNYKATVRFSKRPEVDGIWRDVEDGIIQKFSMGVEILELETLKRTGDEPLVKLAKKWRPFEISIAPVPADPGTTTLSKSKETPMEQATLTADQQRVHEIEQLSAKFKVDATAAIANNSTVESFRAHVLEQLAARSEATPIQEHHTMITRDNREGLTDRMAEALACRYTGQAPSEGAREYMHASTLDMARICLTAAGRRTPGWGAAATIVEALQHGSSDFPNLLQGTGRRMLLNSYEAALPQLLKVSRKSTAKDFRTKMLLRLGEAPKLLKIPMEGAQITEGTRVESKESYRIYPWGRRFSLTREAVINDDLGAFNDIMNEFGKSAAQMQGDQLVSLLVSNPDMEDTVDLFHADHSNLATGGGSALGTSALAAARLLLRKTTGLDGTTILNIEPRYLLVPAALETTAQTILAAIYPATTSNVNPFAGTLELIVEPRLDATSATAWYLFADPSSVPVLEHSYLEGDEAPKIESRQGWDVLGVDFRTYQDFGCGAIGFRGAIKNNGA